ncbi:hypothetical protein Goklo_000111 [Gossypium klotzschianum]|uniref:DUF4283 domain-containing protein n=1 Tax=Gossypium klotzschianum TaxID=34286 RepID=A0A7J8WD11_9ROSI|nr:hypothetical protein [Gossypium klotzschianum]
MEKDLAALSFNDEEEEIIHVQKESDSDPVEEYLCLTGCFLTSNIIHFPTIRSIMKNLWHQIKGVQISDLEEKRFLFRFFHKMDLERVGDFIGKFIEYDGSNMGKGVRHYLRIKGVNLERNLNWALNVELGSSKIHKQTNIEHDGEDGVIEEGNGKKRPRRENDRSLMGEETSSLVLRNRRGLEKNLLVSTAAKGQAYRSQ